MSATLTKSTAILLLLQSRNKTHTSTSYPRNAHTHTQQTHNTSQYTELLPNDVTCAKDTRDLIIECCVGPSKTYLTFQSPFFFPEKKINNQPFPFPVDGFLSLGLF